MRREAAWLVVGADGLLGRRLCDRLAAEGRTFLEGTRREATSPGRIRIDLSCDLRDWRPPSRVDVAFLLAAVTSLKACEADPEGTSRINVQGTLDLAEALANAGSFVVFASTNLVFDGETPAPGPCDPVAPRTEYGRQKAEVERRLLDRGKSAIVRFTKVLGPWPPLFQDWASALERGEAIRPFCDKVMAPIDVRFAVDVLIRVADARLEGITQASASRDFSYEQAAGVLCRRLGASPSRIRGRSAREVGDGAAAEPRHTTLCTKRMTERLGLEPPDPGATLEGVLER